MLAGVERRAPAVPRGSGGSSIISGGIAAQFTGTKGLSARSDSEWIERAATSLPVPDAPVRRTEVGRRATRAMVSRTRSVAGDPDQIVAQEGAVGRGTQGVAQDIVLALEPDTVEASGHGVEDLVGAERLEHEIGRTGAQRLDRGVEVGIGGDQDGVGEKADGALLGEPIDAVLAGHDVVENDDVIAAKMSLREAWSVSAASSTSLQRGPSVRTRKLRMPGSSSTIRIDRLRQRPNSLQPSCRTWRLALLHRRILAATLALDVEKVMPDAF